LATFVINRLTIFFQPRTFSFSFTVNAAFPPRKCVTYSAVCSPQKIRTGLPRLIAPQAVDLFSRRVVGWSMSAAMTAQLVTDALVMAIWRRGKPDNKQSVCAPTAPSAAPCAF
jgi:hypothetical protein